MRHISDRHESMSPDDFEAYVSEIVAGLDFCREGKVTRNRRFEGKTQPGNYEVDIAIEISVGDLLYFFIMVECKNWRRPVDRPVVQKVVQTRTAIAAHKAAIVSPIGFTEEAIQVARSHGVALWVLTAGHAPVSIACFPRSPSLMELILLKVSDALEAVRNYPRKRLAAGLGFVGKGTSKHYLVDIRNATKDLKSQFLWYDRGYEFAANQVMEEIHQQWKNESMLYWLEL